MSEDTTRFLDKRDAAVDLSSRYARRARRWGRSLIVLLALTFLSAVSAAGSTWSDNPVAAAFFAVLAGGCATAVAWTLAMIERATARSEIERMRTVAYSVASTFEQIVDEVDRGKVHDDEEVLALRVELAFVEAAIDG